MTEDDLGKDSIKEAILKLNKEEISKKLDIDMYTLNDILDAFAAPLRDIRDSYDGLKQEVISCILRISKLVMSLMVQLEM